MREENVFDNYTNIYGNMKRDFQYKLGLIYLGKLESWLIDLVSDLNLKLKKGKWKFFIKITEFWY